MSKKLTATYTLNISDQNLPLIQVIASMRGWEADPMYTDEQKQASAETFVNDIVIKPQVAQLFAGIITPSVDKYFGIVGKATADAVKLAYKDNHSVTSVIETVIPE